jgi:phosphoglucomutase
MMKALESRLSPAAAARLAAWRDGNVLPLWARLALDELIAAEAWDELEDRFFRDLSFGTGGMRGRTIGRHAAPAELGSGGIAAPANPAVGANTLNDFTVARATIGLYRQISRRTPRGVKPGLVIAHDVRHFSRRFAELAARTWVRLGGEAWLFDGPRSTPQLSFSVRALGADAGIVITASHNPPHDNGYKVYSRDGAQLIPPQADEVIEAAQSVALPEIGALLETIANATPDWQMVPAEIEQKYRRVATEVIMDPALVRKIRPHVVYSALHGTGGVLVPGLLRGVGAQVTEVAEQMKFDGCFPTVKSPNPEELDALKLAFQKARQADADVALATDPDADRIGSGFRLGPHALAELTGNELGSLLANYRLTRARDLGWLPSGGSPRAVVLKTFVTSPLLDAIAHGHGARSVNTLTGFKWMGAKLRRYDEALHAALVAAGVARSPTEIAALPARERAALHLRHSAWVAFAAEESYGCLAGDAVRDKDGNIAALLCVELAAWLKEKGLTARGALDLLYLRHGFHLEALRTLTFEGAKGVVQIKRILASLRTDVPVALGGRPVASVSDFLRGDSLDEDGEPVPREDFLLYDLTGGWRLAIRGSGTEPKLKIYFFAREPAPSPDALPAVKAAVQSRLESWMEAVLQETRARAGS